MYARAHILGWPWALEQAKGIERLTSGQQDEAKRRILRATQLSATGTNR